jgi:cyclic beta-1,2-glucan synthetase
MNAAPDRGAPVWPLRARGSGGAPAARRATLEAALRDLLERFSALGGEDGTLSRATEWLLDNAYILQGALRQTAEDLPESFCRTLPALRGGAFSGQLRVAVLARQIWTAAAEPLDLERIRRMLEGFQGERPLTLGELWALPSLLRLEAVEDLVRSAGALLAGSFSPGEETEGTARIAADVVGLRTLAAADWRVFFESASEVEKELRRDPAGVYARMDFATRDRYRHEVEELARGSGRSEIEVARAAVRRAEEAEQAAAPGAERARHVGFALLDRGRPELERLLGYRPRLRAVAGRWVRRHPTLAYVGSVTAGMLLLALPPFAWIAGLGLGVPQLVLFGVLLLLLAGTVAVSVENLMVTLSLPPRTLPAMELEQDLPDDCRTLVVVPAMLTSADEVRELLRELEIRFLGNSGENLGFALLTDWADAPAAERPGDAELLRAAVEGVQELDRRHRGTDGRPRFFLLHRERRWNPAEGVWMGWERKRGKLAELDRLLAGDTATSYTTIAGDLAAFGPVRYVLTLDADTFLPRGTAARLAARMAHPLNRPEFDADGRAVAGYSVLQPRVALAPGTVRTRFARLFGGGAGLDLYNSAVSDAYQDLFGVGIYAGKGIYDPVAFERALAGRVPENALLSHDLFEGMHGRAGLASDSVLLEEHPPNLLVSLRRHHRWVRGDWQLLPWLLPVVPAAGGGRIRNRLPGIGRWMMFDNLRRSLFTPALLLLVALGWLWLPHPWIWTLAGASTLALPIFFGGLTAGWRLARGTPWGPTMADTAWSLRTGIAQALAALAVLPCEAVVTLDAILRTLGRLVTGRHRLEWTTAAHAARRLGARPGAAAYWRGMAPAPLLAAGLAALLAVRTPQALPAALPLLALWALSPQLAAWLGRAPAPRREPIAPADRLRLRRLARRTWHFYERFTGPEDHWLPPDNFQEEPGGIVAHRTSPTNIGMLLLSILTAWDLGYLSGDELAARLASLFATLEKLDTDRGHLWNWYDTHSLAPLEPRYVSTVDSGNLAACLLAVAHGCREASRAPALRPEQSAGLLDTLAVLAETVAGTAGAAALTADLERACRRVEGADGTEIPDLLEREWLPRIEDEALALAETGALDSARVADLGTWLERVRHHLRTLRRAAALDRSEEESGRLRRELEGLAARAEARALRMEFDFLFDRDRQLFRIGYNASSGELDPNHYDLLASEARIASFLAIAKGDVPPSHWLHLGRPFATAGSSRLLLLSWGGTMFEFLMPRLLLEHPESTPLAESCLAAVERQIAWAREQRLPWGVSESGYAELDAHRNYRYHAFGVPGLGLKRDLGDRLVVTPYASLLALPVAPGAVLANLERLAGLGMLGRYGLFEALDYGLAATAAGEGQPKIVRSYMAHHQGMILTAIGNALLDDAMVRRFHADPRISTADPLLHEQIPRYVPLREPPPRIEAAAAPLRFAAAAVRAWQVPAGAGPQAQILSNGHYSVLVSRRGGGGSRWNGRVLVRGEADPLLERSPWLHAEDLDGGEPWLPVGETAAPGHEPEVHFAPHLAELHGRGRGLSFRVTVAVAPGEDVEARLVRIVDESGRPRRLALTSYGEVVLATSADDRRHPAFTRLFVVSEWTRGALCFRRRPRSPEEEPIALAHTVVASAPAPEETVWETDRARFVGRGGSARRPAALAPGSPGLSGTTGATLDPIFALRRRIDLAPRGEVEIAFLTAAGRSPEAALDQLDRYRSIARVHELFEQARLHAGPELRHAGIAPEQARAAQELLSAVLQPRSELRAEPAVRIANRKGQSGLWAYGVSGDRPILLLRAGSREDSPFVREVLAAHALWRRRRIEVDLVVLDTGATVYDQPLREWLDREIARSGGAEWRDRPGGVFVVRAALMDPADRTLLEAVAAAVLDAAHGTLESRLRPLRELHEPDRLPVFVPMPSSPLAPEPTPPLARPAGLLCDNGLGGFTADGREYVIHLEPGRATPAPWIHVVANPSFGFLASESGGGFTWAENSAEGRLTPWRNDPVEDIPGETVYLRDEETGEIWTPTRRPAGGDSACQVRYRAGGVAYLQRSRGLEQELSLSVPLDAPVKIAELRLTNLWRRPRRITVTYYAEWVLGTSRRATAPHVISEYDADSGALLARCPYPAGGERTAFLAADRRPHGLTADRAEFLGTPADRARPAGLVRIGLAGAVGPGLDPCAALQIHLDLRPGETVRACFLLGQGADRGAALELISRFRHPAAVDAARREVEAFWDGVLGQVQIATPEPEIDLLANRWLLYQALACRVWGRSALYQPSGAFGFRDQLQDVLALLGGAPDIARGHILEAARHQLEAGDVLHWWHPPAGRGLRSRCSDDLLWLPYAVARYLAVTGDRSILDEPVPFRTGPPLQLGEAERYDLYPESGTSASLYEHCLRAIHHGSTAGAHGLPLIGSCDWNDGMNRVGAAGRGESVWLGWFLHAVLEGFAPICEARGDPEATEEAGRLRHRAESLRQALEASAWDGSWYLRAWYDDGTPLGSAQSRECRIDLLAQSWAVLSGAADPERAALAMDSAWRELERPEEGLTLLLAPPFDRTRHDPGYIRGYPPGVRENGGQYSHAAVWASWAFALLGDGDRAAAVLRTIDPLYRTATPEGVERYRVEPYVVAGDIAGAPPHTGRGGWTWYTGAAAWTHRLIVEALLGLRREAGMLEIDPCIPRSWPGFRATLRVGGAVWRVEVENPEGVSRGVVEVRVDGEPVDGARIALIDDGGEHDVEIRMGAPAGPDETRAPLARRPRSPSDAAHAALPPV